MEWLRSNFNSSLNYPSWINNRQIVRIDTIPAYVLTITAAELETETYPQKRGMPQTRLTICFIYNLFLSLMTCLR